MMFPFSVRIREPEIVVESHIVKDDCFFFTVRDSESATNLLEEKRQGFRRTSQLDEINIRTIKAFSENLNIDEDIYLTGFETGD